MRILVLALGNELFGDDAVGFLVADNLIPLISGMGDSINVIKSHEVGLKLLDYFLLEYDHVILVDSILGDEPGRITKISPDSLGRATSFSPHYAGIPEMLELMRELGVELPEIEIYAIEIKNADLGSKLSDKVKISAEKLAQLIRDRIFLLLSKDISYRY